MFKAINSIFQVIETTAVTTEKAVKLIEREVDSLELEQQKRLAKTKQELESLRE